MAEYYLKIFITATRWSSSPDCQVDKYLKRKQLTPQKSGYIQDQDTSFQILSYRNRISYHQLKKFHSISRISFHTEIFLIWASNLPPTNNSPFPSTQKHLYCSRHKILRLNELLHNSNSIRCLFNTSLSTSSSPKCSSQTKSSNSNWELVGNSNSQAAPRPQGHATRAEAQPSAGTRPSGL